jgi:outer membrane protein OmpA-like peptidoglycan-associated protein
LWYKYSGQVNNFFELLIEVHKSSARKQEINISFSCSIDPDDFILALSQRLRGKNKSGRGNQQSYGNYISPIVYNSLQKQNKGRIIMKRITRILVSVVCLSLLTVGVASSKEKDAKDCKDHPLISRMNNYYISSCEKSFNSFTFYVKEGEKALDGEMTKISYNLQEGSPQPSFLQIRRNYGNAVKNIGGVVLYDDDRRGTFKVTKEGKDAWIALEAFNEGRNYELVILELAPMTQEVTADAMYNALNKDGFMALYINFDTGKSNIKPESIAIIDQIAALLKSHPSLKVSIEGHTDNVGTPQSNKALSTQRAKSVMSAVAQKGIAVDRMIAVGWGQEKPIADNRSEDGKAKNRRVEIVKK